MSRRDTTKSGAALLIALGFLAILTFLIVAFAIQMRNERIAGRDYLSDARTRQLLHTALTRAMLDIDTSFSTNYPDRLAISSLGNTGIPMAGTINFTTEEQYIPLGNASIDAAYQTARNAAQWETISVSDAAAPAAVGRMGYVIINTSGLLDANTVGGLTGTSTLVDRNRGLSPEEIVLDPGLIPELTAVAELIQPDGTKTETNDGNLAFVHNRETVWQRFESLRDVKTLNSDGRGGVMEGELSAFSTFSLFPSNHVQSLELAATLDPTRFETSLTANCGLSQGEARTVVENYFDYIDADDLPRNLRGSSPERVPMINEVWLEELNFSQNANDATNVRYRVSGQLHFETWYPFAGTPPVDFAPELKPMDPEEGPDTVEIITGEEFIGQSGYITVICSYSNSSAKAFILPLSEQADGPVSDGKFSTYSYDFSYDERVLLDLPFQTTPPPTPETLRFMQDRIELTQAAGTLDAVYEISLDVPFAGNGEQQDVYAECVDPRINSDFTNIRHWQFSETGSANAVNLLDDWGEEADLNRKSDILFYTRNAPMENAAELGHLSLGTPWRTVRLYGGDATAELHPVLDFFQTGESFRAEPQRPGLVNCNSPHGVVLASAFLGAPIQVEFETGPADERVTLAQARMLGDNLAAFSAERVRTSPCQIGHAWSSNVPGWGDLTDAQKESIVANSYRLFGERDSLYTIFLVAQAGTDADEDGRIADEEVRGTQQAVVTVWRDPSEQSAAVVFYGLTDTLRSSINGGETWSTLLEAFRP